MASPFFPSLTKVWHDEPYPAISPSRPELSVQGKVVVVTGGGSGIGASIAKAFAAGGSTEIAVMGRTEAKLLETKRRIEEIFPETQVLPVTADINNQDQINEAFSKIHQTFGKIDILVCSSGSLTRPKPILQPDLDIQEWWNTFNTNILGALLTVKGFARYAAEGAHILNISTAIAHMPPLEPGVSAYAASKAAAIKLFDYIAFENPTLHIVNIQPGLIDTEMSRKSGHGGMDHIDLPGQFCLWLASPEADFLKSKFVWVNWDVDELKARREEILSTDLLDTKLGGVSFVNWKGREMLDEV